MQSLYDRLGGQEAVDTVVETFYRKVLTDDRISDFFDDTDMEEQIAKQKSFLSMVFGGPANYSGLEMREAHKHLVKRGLNGDHVDAVIELLGSSLKDHGVTDDDVSEVAKIAESVRDDVLNR
jgi:hemoglobin